MEALQVIKATSKEELALVFALRKIVFVEEQGVPPEIEWDKEEESTHFLALSDYKPCGACRWRKTPNGYKLERFAVLKDYRGNGIGRAMIATALADLPDDAGYIYLNAQVDAKSLYAKFGFVAEGEEFEEAGIKHLKMVKKT